MPPPYPDDPAQPSFPPLRTSSVGAKARRVVGFDTSPSSVLRPAAAGDDSPASTSGRPAGEPPAESPLAAALKRERSMPQLPRLKLGGGSKGLKAMPRSKSHGNLVQRHTQPAEVPSAPKPALSATNSPHASSSGGSEPVRIPFGLARRRTASVDFSGQHGGLTDDDLASTPIISAASSLLGHHLGGGGPGSSTAGSPHGGAGVFGGGVSGGGVAMQRSQSVAKDLFVAQADAVMAHAQVQSLQAALRKEQEEVVRLREQLQLMTAERDRLLVELQQGGGGEPAPVFDMEAPAQHSQHAVPANPLAHAHARVAPPPPAQAPMALLHHLHVHLGAHHPALAGPAAGAGEQQGQGQGQGRRTTPVTDPPPRLAGLRLR